MCTEKLSSESKYANGVRMFAFRQSMNISKQVKHTVKINILPYTQLKFGSDHVIKQKFKHDRTAESSSLNLEIREPHGKINVKDIVDPDKTRVLHCF